MPAITRLNDNTLKFSIHPRELEYYEIQTGNIGNSAVESSISEIVNEARLNGEIIPEAFDHNTGFDRSLCIYYISNYSG